MNIFLDHVNNTNGLSGLLDTIGYGCMKPLHWTIAPFMAERIKCHDVGWDVEDIVKRYRVKDTTTPIYPQARGYLTTAWRVASLALGLLLVTFTTPLALFLKGIARFSKETRLKYQATFPLKKDAHGVPKNAEKIDLSSYEARTICCFFYPIFGLHAYDRGVMQLKNNFKIAYGEEINSLLSIQKTTIHVVVEEAWLDYMVSYGQIAGYKKEKTLHMEYYWLIFNPLDLDNIREGKLPFAPGKDNIITKASLLARYRQLTQDDQLDEVEPSLFEKVRAYFKPVKIEE